MFSRLAMGLGKTFTGAEKTMRMRTSINLIVCQKSKIDDWIGHFKLNYNTETYDLTAKEDFKRFMFVANEDRSDNLDPRQHVGIINYDLVFRRRDLLDLTNFTLTLDESSLISNPTAKRTKFIHRLNPSNVILL
ncbi:MAG: SNF2-related protein, partial [Oscillospiraceae bacterium]